MLSGGEEVKISHRKTELTSSQERIKIATSYRATMHGKRFSTTKDIKMEKAMAPLSNTLACKIPWMEEPGGLQSMGSL